MNRFIDYSAKRWDSRMLVALVLAFWGQEPTYAHWYNVLGGAISGVLAFVVIAVICRFLYRRVIK